MCLVLQASKKERSRVHICNVFVAWAVCASVSTPPSLPLQRGGIVFPLPFRRSRLAFEQSKGISVKSVNSSDLSGKRRGVPLSPVLVLT